MPESGGPAAQAGLHYQNSVAAFALVKLLALDVLEPREQVVKVRVEALEPVNDVVIEFADGHSEFQSVKLRIDRGNRTWKAMWTRLAEQVELASFRNDDQLTLVVEKSTRASEMVRELGERARACEASEFRSRLSNELDAALTSIGSIVGAKRDYEVVRRTKVLHCPMDAIEADVRRWLDGHSPSPSLFSILRDIVTQGAGRRGAFSPLLLRERLRDEHGITLPEPVEWRLDSYRATIRRQARIEVPGTRIAGPAERVFVWPRARKYDPTRVSSFEDEDPTLVEPYWERHLDLRAFPDDRLNRILVVGGPGYGKSALLTAIGGKLAEGPRVPALVPLARLSSSGGSVIEFLSDTVNSDLDVAVNWRSLAEQGLLVALFDGLDEVPGEKRARLMGRVADFSARYPLVRWMVTARDPAVAAGIPEATVLVELLPLDSRDMDRFTTAMAPYLGDKGGWQFVRRLELYPDLYRLARIPLFLAMLLATYDLENAGPLTRSELIEGYLKTLFRPGEHKRYAEDRIGRPALLREVAETLAFECLERQQIGATEEDVLKIMDGAPVSVDKREAVVEQLKANGILKLEGPVGLKFPFPIVQEYLAAHHLVGRHPDEIESRIEDAVRRPWAQVIQFALELHPEPEAIIEEMLDRPDDAFCTGLRLVGRCVANGASVGSELRDVLAGRLVDYWTRAPWRSRERVGRLLADGFSDPPSKALLRVLHHRWLIEDGAGDIVSKLNDPTLTIEVLESLIESDRSGLGVYHSLKPALRAMGDAAFRTVADKLDPDKLDGATVEAASNLLESFPDGVVSPGVALGVAKDRSLPPLTRMRAYRVAGAPLEEEGASLAKEGLRHGDGAQQYGARMLISLHDEPERFMGELIRDRGIALTRRVELAASVAGLLPDRQAFVKGCMADSSVEDEIKIALRLVDARFGNKDVFGGLVEDLVEMPLQHARTTIALLGHFRVRALAERAAALLVRRDLPEGGKAEIAGAAVTGMLYVFEMDMGFGGVLVSAPPHPGVPVWLTLLEDWCGDDDLTQSDRLAVLTAASELGSEWARAEMEREVSEIDDWDASPWIDGEKKQGTLTAALREIQRGIPGLALSLIEKALASNSFNVMMVGVRALQARSDATALNQLIALHDRTTEWVLRGSISESIELVAARLGVVIGQERGRYRIVG